MIRRVTNRREADTSRDINRASFSLSADRQFHIFMTFRTHVRALR